MNQVEHTAETLLPVELKVMDPDDDSWTDELPEKQVLLFDDEVHVRIRIPKIVDSLSQLTAIPELSKIKLKTSLTNPTGIDCPLDDQHCTFAIVTGSDGTVYNEVRTTLTSGQLKTLGLLPTNHVLGKAWLDDGYDDPTASSNLSDGRAFALGMPGQLRGQSTLVGNLNSIPPNSPGFDVSFVKAAGVEIITAELAGVSSAKREIMNQADCLYLSVEGHHNTGSINTLGSAATVITVTSQDVSGYWNNGLKTVVIAGCAVLDINDYNNYYTGTEHTSSPGLLWAKTGPSVLLGYNYAAPKDNNGGTAIIQEWLAIVNRGAVDKISAWQEANEEFHAWNACAIENGVLYGYFNATFVLGVPVDHNWMDVDISGM